MLKHLKGLETMKLEFNKKTNQQSVTSPQNRLKSIGGAVVEEIEG